MNAESFYFDDIKVVLNDNMGWGVRDVTIFVCQASSYAFYRIISKFVFYELRCLHEARAEFVQGTSTGLNWDIMLNFT